MFGECDRHKNNCLSGNSAVTRSSAWLYQLGAPAAGVVSVQSTRELWLDAEFIGDLG